MNNPKVKSKKGVIIAAIVLIAGAVGYYLWKRKKDKETEVGATDGGTELTKDASASTKPEKEASDITKSTPIVTKSNPLKTNVTIPKDAPKGVKAEFNQPATLVSAVDLLAGDPNGAYHKSIFAQVSNLPVYNMNGQKAFVTKKGQWIGYVTKVQKIGGFYRLFFLGSGGVKYYMPASGVLVKTN